MYEKRPAFGCQVLKRLEDHTRWRQITQRGEYDDGESVLGTVVPGFFPPLVIKQQQRLQTPNVGCFLHQKPDSRYLYIVTDPIGAAPSLSKGKLSIIT